MLHRICVVLSTNDRHRLAIILKKIKNTPEFGIPNDWCGRQGQDGSASIDWVNCFMRRHSELSLRKPQATRLSRVTSFKQHNVKTETIFQ